MDRYALLQRAALNSLPAVHCRVHVAVQHGLSLLCLSCGVCPACPAPPRPLEQVHKAIRANPMKEAKARTKPAKKETWHEVKLTQEQRKENLKQKLATLMDDDE